MQAPPGSAGGGTCDETTAEHGTPVTGEDYTPAGSAPDHAMLCHAPRRGVGRVARQYYNVEQDCTTHPAAQEPGQAGRDAPRWANRHQHAASERCASAATSSAPSEPYESASDGVMIEEAASLCPTLSTCSNSCTKSAWRDMKPAPGR